MRLLALCHIAAAGAICTTGAFAQGVDWYVDVNGTAPGTGTIADPYTSIHYAVQQSTTQTGDTVIVLPGRYEETVEIVRKGITLRSSAGATETIIDAQYEGTAVTVIGGDTRVRTEADCSIGVTIEGFTIVNGTGTMRRIRTMGGGILAENVLLDVSKCIIRDNTAAMGGGVAIRNSFVSMYDNEIRENKASTGCLISDGQGGGVWIFGSGLRMLQSSLRENTAAVGSNERRRVV